MRQAQSGRRAATGEVHAAEFPHVPELEAHHGPVEFLQDEDEARVGLRFERRHGAASSPCGVALARSDQNLPRHAQMERQIQITLPVQLQGEELAQAADVRDCPPRQSVPEIPLEAIAQHCRLHGLDRDEPQAGHRRNELASDSLYLGQLGNLSLRSTCFPES
jgi:hypothetical protein